MEWLSIEISDQQTIQGWFQFSIPPLGTPLYLNTECPRSIGQKQ